MYATINTTKLSTLNTTLPNNKFGNKKENKLMSTIKTTTTTILTNTDKALDTVVIKSSYGVGFTAGITTTAVNKVTKNYLVKNPLTRWVSKKVRLSIDEATLGFKSGVSKIK